MKCQILFSGKNKKNLINLLSAHSMVSVKGKSNIGLECIKDERS